MASSQRPRLNPVTPAYIELVQVLDQRRRGLGLSHEELCTSAGIGQRQWAKYLNPDASSGRVACWATLQRVFAALYPQGYSLRIEPKADAMPIVVGDHDDGSSVLAAASTFDPAPMASGNH
jgi:hypothetical protein